MNCELCASKRKKRKTKRERETLHRKEGQSDIVSESWRGRRWRFSGCGYSKHSVHREKVTY